jgi:hypothetical protein
LKYAVENIVVGLMAEFESTETKYKSRTVEQKSENKCGMYGNIHLTPVGELTKLAIIQ